MRLANILRAGLPGLLCLAATVASAETLIDTWGTFGSGPGQFSFPGGAYAEDDEFVYVADQGNNRIQKFRSDGTFVMQWGVLGSAPGQLNNPARIHLAPNGELLVTEHQNHRTSRWTRDGVFLGLIGDTPGPGQAVHPVGVSTDVDGNIYVVGATSNRVHKYASDGHFLFSWGGFSMPYGCYVGPDGLVYVSEYTGSRVQVFTRDGAFVRSFGSTGSGPGQFNAAEATVMDPDGNLYVADTGNDRVQKFTATGVYLGEFPVPPSNQSQHRPIPCDLAISSDAKLYVVGFGSARIYKYALQSGPPPSIASFTPGAGAPGTVVTIQGSHFTGTASVRFGGLSSTFTEVSDSELRATVPAAARTAPIRVATGNGEGFSATSFIVAPRITSFTPLQGPIGSTITINGANFTGTTAVRFNGTSASFTVLNDDALHATVPSGATTGALEVTNPGGTATSTTSFRVGPLPTITSFTPIGGAPGTIVTISGAGFTDASQVRFAALAASFTAAGDAEIRATVPTAAHSGKIFVTTPDGVLASPDSFIVRPVLTSWSPAQAPVGYPVTILGSNFTRTTSVRFNGTAAAFTLVSDTEIRTEVPSGATTGLLGVTNPGGTGQSSQDFRVGPLPQVASLDPSAGAPGNVITIHGVGFTGATAVRFNTTTASFTFVDDTRIDATVPADAHTGRVFVVIPNQTLASPDSFVVAPRISSFSPVQAPVGHTITIQGYNFTRTSSVHFNATPAAFTLVSDTQLMATVPSGAGSGPITVTNPGGSGSSGNFTVGPLPQISSFTPTAGAPGLLVTISGTGFVGTSHVRFLNTEAVYSVISDSEIRATVPVGARTGPIAVVTNGSNLQSSTSFIVAPQITSFTPIQAPIGHVITIRGVNFTATSAVLFDDVAAAFDEISDIEVHATVPSGAIDGRIAVTNPGGSDTSDQIFYVGPLQAPGGGMNLSWDDCGLSGSASQAFACNETTGPPFTLVGSFRPPEGVVEFLGISAQVDITSSSSSLPDWWKFGSTQCRSTTGMSVNFDFTAGPASCLDPFQGRAAGGFAYDVGFGSPNRARLRVQAAIPIDDRGPVDAAREYYAFKTLIQRSKGTGTGACAGCDVPMCIVMNSIQLFQPPERTFDPLIQTEIDRGFVTWQSKVAGCPLSTPVQATLVTAEAFADRVRLVWDTPGLDGATLYRRQGTSGWQSLALLSPDGSHRMTYQDRDVTPGATYDYRLGISVPAGEVYAAETRVTVPAAKAELELARVTLDGTRGVTVSFTLVSSAPAALELYDLAGRRLATRRLEGLTPGSHELSVAAHQPLRAGVYFVRLSQAGAQASRRFVAMP